MKDYYIANYVSEIKGAENVSYIIKQDDAFFMTGYKVLSGKENKGLVTCARLRYNGSIKLVYFSSQYMSLQTIVGYLDGVGVKTVLRNLISNVLAIKGNGFLKCENIEVSSEKIFVDRNTLEVYLIYLPIKMTGNEYDKSVFENELRTQLIKVLNTAASINDSGTKTILFELSNGNVSLEQLHRILQQMDMGYRNEKNSGETHEVRSMVQSMVLESLDGRNVFNICQKEFVIGKNAGMSEGIISGNPAVSRKHCKIVRRDEGFYLVDLNSSNGTYLNGNKLRPEEPAHIVPGNQIRIANIDFIVK